MAKENVYLESKPRYEILDGLRGVAALMVLFFHCFETYVPVIGTQVVNHGFLGVDFFFVLSGFVIGYAYDDRWDKMTTWGFFKRRIVRLHPMLVAGTVIGASLFFLGASEGLNNIADCKGWMFALCFVMGILMIPCGPGLDIRGFSETYTFTGPAWTLMYEYIGNILYALFLRKLPTFVLAVLCAASAFFILDLTLGLQVITFPASEIVLPDGSTASSLGPHYNVVGGWSLTPDHVYIGFARLLYPFLCGLVISRILRSRITPANPSGSPLHAKGGFWWCSLILAVIFCIPQVGGKPGLPDGIFQAFSILVVFPIVVLLGAGSVTESRAGTRICKFLGNLSYPLYITHYPLMYLQMAWVNDHPGAPVWMNIMLNVGIVILAIFIAWACFKIYDEPLREWLKEHWLKGKRRVARA